VEGEGATTEKETIVVSINDVGRRIKVDIPVSASAPSLDMPPAIQHKKARLIGRQFKLCHLPASQFPAGRGR